MSGPLAGPHGPGRRPTTSTADRAPALRLQPCPDSSMMGAGSLAALTEAVGGVVAPCCRACWSARRRGGPMDAGTAGVSVVVVTTGARTRRRACHRMGGGCGVRRPVGRSGRGLVGPGGRGLVGGVVLVAGGAEGGDVVGRAGGWAELVVLLPKASAVCEDEDAPSSGEGAPHALRPIAPARATATSEGILIPGCYARDVIDRWRSAITPGPIVTTVLTATEAAVGGALKVSDCQVPTAIQAGRRFLPSSAACRSRTPPGAVSLVLLAVTFPQVRPTVQYMLRTLVVT